MAILSSFLTNDFSRAGLTVSPPRGPRRPVHLRSSPRARPCRCARTTGTGRHPSYTHAPGVRAGGWSLPRARKGRHSAACADLLPLPVRLVPRDEADPPKRPRPLGRGGRSQGGPNSCAWPPSLLIIRVFLFVSCSKKRTHTCVCLFRHIGRHAELPLAASLNDSELPTNY